jgi:hypothetical protein
VEQKFGVAEYYFVPLNKPILTKNKGVLDALAGRKENVAQRKKRTPKSPD